MSSLSEKVAYIEQRNSDLEKVVSRLSKEKDDLQRKLFHVGMSRDTLLQHMRTVFARLSRECFRDDLTLKDIRKGLATTLGIDAEQTS
jgi:hypothetical protein